MERGLICLVIELIGVGFSLADLVFKGSVPFGARGSGIFAVVLGVLVVFVLGLSDHLSQGQFLTVRFLLVWLIRQVHHVELVTLVIPRRWLLDMLDCGFGDCNAI